MNEQMVCQAKAIMRELWPDEFGDIKPDLRLVRVDGREVVDRAASAVISDDVELKP